jgi:hypothetical protein
MTPTLPFDFDFDAASKAASDARMADRELCRNYLASWAGNFGRETPRSTSISFEEFSAAAARLAA